MQKNNRPSLEGSRWVCWVGRLMIVLGLVGAADSRAQTPRYAGRPFVRVAQSNATDPAAGFISGLGRAQLVGNAVVFVAESGISVSGVFSGRGGPLTKVVGIGETMSGVTLQAIHTGFARDTGAGAIALAAGPTQTDAVQFIEGATLTTLLAPGTVLPNSGGKVANVMGEPFLAQGQLAVVAWHALPNGGGVDFRGIYRVSNGTPTPVADTATALPGIGIPDTFSSQVGFDGQTIAFWATRGPFAEAEGIFAQTADGTVTKIAQNGDVFPGGGAIDGFISPPFVSGGVVYFFAYDSASVTRLMKHEAGTLTVLAANGDATPKGALQGVGQAGLAVEGGTVFFPARTAAGPGLYAIEGGSLQTIIAPGTAVAGILPTSIVLQDVAGDTIVIEASNFSTRRLAANLAEPAVPVIVTDLADVTAAAGARVELRVEAVGDAPLTYTWTKNNALLPEATGQALVLPAAAEGDVARYRVTVTNAFGSVSSISALVNVEVPPRIVNLPATLEVEVGDPLTLRAETGGGLPQTFAWTKDGSPVTSDSPALGFFVRTSAGANDGGHYTVLVTNPWGTATAQADVIIKPASPNPIYRGGRWVKILDKDTVAPGTEEKFSTTTLSEYSARFFGSQVVFVGQSMANVPLGVFAWENGNLVRVLAPDATLPNGLGAAAGFTLVTALPNEPLTVRAQQVIGGFPRPVGIYRVNGANLDVIVDTTMAAPNGNGALFPNLFGGGMAAGGTIRFSETVEATPSIYLWENGALSRILNARQNLPVVGTATTQFQGLAANGNEFVVVAATSGQAQLAALKVSANGDILKLLATGDTLPGTASQVRLLGASGADGSAFYLIVYDTAFAQHVVAWNDGVATRILGPNMPVTGLGTIQSLSTSFLKAGSGRVYSGARVLIPQATLLGVVAGGRDGIEPVLFTSKLDARQISASYVTDARGDQVLLMVQFNDGTRGFYANVGAVEEELRLEFTRTSATTLRFTIPEGASLEASLTPDGTFEPAVSAEVTITEGNRFFRLRK